MTQLKLPLTTVDIARAASSGSSKRFIFKYFLSKAGVIKLPALLKKNISENLARISKFSLKNRSFINTSLVSQRVQLQVQVNLYSFASR